MVSITEARADVVGERRKRPRLASSISVLLADDHPSVRMGVRIALELTREFEVCAEAKNAAEAVQMAVQRRPRICLLDINMPGGGIEAAAQISRLLPDTEIVM